MEVDSEVEIILDTNYEIVSSINGSYKTDEHGCFNHMPGSSYTGPKPRKTNVQNNFQAYQTDIHGCLKHEPYLVDYNGPTPIETNVQNNFQTYPTNDIGNLIDKNNLYSGPKPNDSERAKETLKYYVEEKRIRNKHLENFIKKRNKYFMRGWYTTQLRTSAQ